MARSRMSVRPVVLAGAVLLAAVLSSCSATNDITTARAYSASDGVRGELGDVTAENLLLVAAAANEPGALQGALSNRGEATVTITITTSESSEDVRVLAGETVLFGGANGEELLLTTPDAPGATTDLTLASGPGGTLELQVPVVDGTLPEYADLLPDEA